MRLMLYRLSQHAQQRMRLRSISEADVDAVLSAPGQIVPEERGKNAYQSKLRTGGKTVLLRVIVADQESPAIVVTVYITTRIDKYWI